ncbi:uncharacterized protein LOC100827917 isoform X1 [Brachypodium distachyon]|uniref:Transcription factor IIIC 90kDa subunit N-terminal domain-containing protein n=1 Tax=Brachypodium distachyon TaxID=15368 RepID=A0A0Q3HCD1_BRADI|nr:uncharacterized protein LOC100827917 isoform X1 [Brachypodium distachyon]KQK20542.1 hypothetical protein BRADI_1g55216v3 [Brachypodium distachyon]KQK20543.1 hypothetical protein BRADI_1g55216v3 [Brachypodium distachyon]PNT76883.1 hypothetical protein BRADI_1g55216v3 [Brachypodium distachyon]|eukprot:XP_024312618.1 uncharacterized protein LOC100827917 isoform X1 [Brachypodium distachyon]
MAAHYQATTLIASPSYPNAIAWSSENLVAVASGHVITILNPASLDGPRGIALLRPSDPFPIGVVNRDDLFEPCLVPTSLARDTEPCARSISWSQQGFAPNASCLLAVCTVDGHVNLYRPPVYELCDDWVKVADISQLLFNYYQDINFGEDDGPDLFQQEELNNEHTHGTGYAGELQEPLSSRGPGPGRRKRKPARVESYVYNEDQDDLGASEDADFSLNPCSKTMKRSMKKIVKPVHEMAVVIRQGVSQNTKEPLSCNGENKLLPHITAKQYAYRNAVLSSLVVAWSPVLLAHDASRWCILAVGSKSGDVSFWKIHKPVYYTIDVCTVYRDPILIGVLQAHNSWVSAMSWEVFSASSSKCSLLLATGCTDGSVKIWSGDIKELNQCTDVKGVPFSLVTEVTTISSAPVSSISSSLPAQPQYELNLAVGRVSGSLETWTFDLCTNIIKNSSACHAHDRVVTGLSWGLDGHCLYSCSQDNSARCWIFEKNHLQEIPLHTNFLEQKESTNLSEVSDRCYGLTPAPGELMIAVVRSLDPNMLDQMYQARTQKAVVEFIWIGGQFLGIPLDKSIHICSQQSAMLSVTNLLWWGSNIFWSLKKYEKSQTGLVLWDVIAALQVIKKYAPTFLEIILNKWISDDQHCVSVDIPYESINDMISKASSRKLHLLNIICRKVMLSSHSTDLWNNLLASSERELRERLVAFTFSAVLSRTSYFLKGSQNRWFPVGVAQMDSWVSMNSGVCNQLKSLSSAIKDLGRRIDSVCEYSVDETCAYCSAPVHFESPDVALCGGVDPSIAPAERHKLSRCTASMRLCSVLQPIWYCACCGGMVDKLVPETFFTMMTSPLGGNHDEESLYSAPAVPLCPFCGILLQRLTPEFLLSISPV